MSAFADKLRELERLEELLADLRTMLDDSDLELAQERLEDFLQKKAATTPPPNRPKI